MRYRLPRLIACGCNCRPTSAWTIPATALTLAAATLVWIGYEEHRQAVEQEYRYLDAHAQIAATRIADEISRLAPLQRTEDFAELMKDIRPAPPDAAAAIVDADGDAVYPLPPSSGGKPAPDAFLGFLRADRQPTLAVGIAPGEASERMYAFRAVANAPLNVAVSRPLDEVLATWRRNGVVRLGLFLLVAAAILPLAWVAQRRQQEARAGKEFAERLIETANAMMVGVDTRGRIIAVNEATERVSGYRRDELLDHSFFETLMPRERYPRAWNAFLHYRETSHVPRAFEAPVRTKGGEERMIAWQNSPALAGGSDELAILSFGIDVTERTQLQQAREHDRVSRRLVAIQDEERRRLAIELHDRTSPNLTVLDINFRLLADSLPQEASHDCAHLLEDTSATLADTIASIRAISFDFRPPLLDYAGFWPALEAYARQFSRRTGIEVRTTHGEAQTRPAPEIETNLFRIAQEAMTNCARHAHAETILIRQEQYGNEVVFTIEDDGVGFDATAAGAGQGLVTMRQRAEFVGGHFSVDTRPGQGTRIAVAFAMPVSQMREPLRTSYAVPASQASVPRPAARPLEQHAVSR